MRKTRNLLLILAAGFLLAGCGKNPYNQGMEALESGAYAEAADQFQQAVAGEKNTADSYRGLGLALWEQEDYEGARDAFVSALEQGSQESGTIYNLLGNCEMELQNAEQAYEYYEKGLAMEGNSEELIQEMKQGRIAACEELGDLESAKTLLAEYLEEYPDDEAAAKEAEFLETR